MIIGTGIDIVDIRRFGKAIQRWGEPFLHHIFHPEEIHYAQSKKFPEQHLAARFAAKEAVVKALGDNRSIGWKDMKIEHNPFGQPQCRFVKKKFPHQIFISLSHTHDHAIASAIITPSSSGA